MPDTTGKLDALLSADPLHAAEQLTGTSYKNSDATTALGAMIAMSNHERADALLRASSDTRFSMPFDEHLAVFATAGFQIVLDEPFTGTDDAAERFVVLWRPDGVLASCESYSRWDSTNSSHVYYNWRPDDPEDTDRWWPLISSGHMTDGVWVGDHDTREALRHKLAGLESAGRFVSPWPQPHRSLGLLSYADWRRCGNDREQYRAVRRDRFGRLPAAVREALGAVDSDA